MSVVDLQELEEVKGLLLKGQQLGVLTFAEIAQVLGTTPGAVKLRAFRGYETLRSTLKEFA